VDGIASTEEEASGMRHDRVVIRVPAGRGARL